MLDELVRRGLAKTAASASGQVRAVLRARIVLLAADGMDNARIAHLCRTSVNTVRKWLGRFIEHGVAGLLDARRSGRPRLYGTEARLEIVAVDDLRAAVPGIDLVAPACRRVVQRPGHLQFAGRRILRDLDVRPAGCADGSPAARTRRSGSLPRRSAACTSPRHPARYGYRSTRRLDAGALAHTPSTACTPERNGVRPGPTCEGSRAEHRAVLLRTARFVQDHLIWEGSEPDPKLRCVMNPQAMGVRRPSLNFVHLHVSAGQDTCLNVVVQLDFPFDLVI